MNKYIYFVDKNNALRADLTTPWKEVATHHIDIIENHVPGGGAATVWSPGKGYRSVYTDRALIDIAQGGEAMMCIMGDHSAGDDLLAKVPVYVIIER